MVSEKGVLISLFLYTYAISPIRFQTKFDFSNPKIVKNLS